MTSGGTVQATRFRARTVEPSSMMPALFKDSVDHVHLVAFHDSCRSCFIASPAFLHMLELVESSQIFGFAYVIGAGSVPYPRMFLRER